MATIIPHTTRATGTVLTASIYNSDHQVHITNATSLNDELAGSVNVGDSTGIIVGNGAGDVFGRTLQAGSGISITNPTGVSDDPSIGLSGNVDITSAAIHSTSNTSNLELAGGNNGGVGANIQLFGGAHATNANNAFYDADLHTVRTQSASFLSGGTPLLTVNGTIKSQETAGGVGRFIGGDTVILAPAVAGTIDLRPAGPSDTTGRLTFGAAGLTLANNLTVTGDTSLGDVTTSAPILATNGTAANPSYGFVGDAGTNTGMYRAAENTIGFTTGGTLAMSIGTNVDVVGRMEADRFISRSGVFSQDVSVPGTISLRPNGPDSTSGQASLDTSGTFTSERVAAALGVFASASAGTMSFRPNGPTNSAEQMTLSTLGNLVVNGSVTADGVTLTGFGFSDIAGAAAGAIGTYAMARPSPLASVDFGGLASGTNLVAASATGDPDATLGGGNWRCLGHSIGTTIANSTTLWVRVT